MFSSNTTQVSSGGYQISRSLRFNSADSAYLNRTPASTGSRTTFTFSTWVKRSSLNTATRKIIFSSGSSTTMSVDVYFQQGGVADQLWIEQFDGANNFYCATSAVYRDPSAWYHIVIAVDTTQATTSNRVQMYVNGSQITSFYATAYPTQNFTYPINTSSYSAKIGLGTQYNTQYYDGYQTEVNFIDGSQLTPSSFGETNAQTGVWQPKAYSGSYGTNGFYLNFSDNSNTTAATLGKDYSGNGNNWTPNNFSVSAGAGNDSLVDSPTSYGTDTGVGGEVRGNYATLNPLDYSLQATTTFTNGNLDASIPYSIGYTNAQSTISVSSGKWYCEVTPTNANGAMIGICDATLDTKTQKNWSNAYWWGYFQNGNKYNSNAGTSYGSSFTTNDVIGIALDMDTGAVTFYKNGTSQGVAFNTNISGRTIQISLNNGSGSTTQTYTINFGQRPFAYTAPSGYKALCTQNLPTPTIGATSTTLAGNYSGTNTYTGTGATQVITNSGFQPDLVWLKIRSGASNHVLIDSVRGYDKYLGSSTTAAESTSTDQFLSFNSNGFTLGSNVGAGGNTNQSGSTYVGWQWRGNGSGSSNTAGSITSTVSANTTSGFSVVTYTGNSTVIAANGTVGHGLGVVPSMIIIKRRDNTGYWWVATKDGGTSSSPTYSWFTRGSSGLNNTGAAFATGQTFASSGYITSSIFNVYWLNAAVTAGDSYDINFLTATYVAYCFAEVAGYSKFGSYTGNGSADGPFVYCGFRPAYVMIKGTATGRYWIVKDKLRAANYNPQDGNLYPNDSLAEDTTASAYIDFLSNGFKIRGTYVSSNYSGDTFIFAAFAEAPQKFALAR